MTDIPAALGLVAREDYDTLTSPRRNQIISKYNKAFSAEKWAVCPVFENEFPKAVSSYHLYMLRIKGADEKVRDNIITEIFNGDVSVNVHFQPLPLLTAYQEAGYKMDDYPESYKMYCNEITLPVYHLLTDEQVDIVIEVVKNAVNKFL